MSRSFAATPRHNSINTPQRRNSPISLRKVHQTPDTGRREVHEAAIRIQETLQQNPNFYASLNLVGGLKSMTAKQFILIVNHLAECITGKPFAAVDKADPANDIVNSLKDMLCPFIVNKSLFKAPTAPHAYESGIRLLQWMCDFVAKQTPVDTLNLFHGYKDFIQADPMHPSADYTKVFNGKVLDGFHLWNNHQDDEYLKIVQEMVNELIASRTDGCVVSEESLLENTKRLHANAKKLAKVSLVIPNEKKFEAAESDLERLEFIAMNLEVECSTAKDEMEAVKLRWKSLHETVEDYRRTVTEMKHIIATQRWNVTQLNALKADIQQQNYLIQIENDVIAKQQDINSQQKIQLARLIRDRANLELKLQVYFTEKVQLLKEAPFSQYQCVQEFIQLVKAEGPLDYGLIKEKLQEIDRITNEMLLHLQRTEIEQGIKVQEKEILLASLRQQEQSVEQERNQIHAALLKLKKQYATQCSEYEHKLKNAMDKFEQGVVMVNQLEQILVHKRKICNDIEKVNSEITAKCSRMATTMRQKEDTLNANCLKLLTVLELMKNCPDIDEATYSNFSKTASTDLVQAADKENRQMSAHVQKLLDENADQSRAVTNVPLPSEWALLSDARIGSWSNELDEALCKAKTSQSGNWY